MAELKPLISTVDPVWSRVCDEACEMVRTEPLLGALAHSSLLHHPTMERALAYRFSLKLASGEMSGAVPFFLRLSCCRMSTSLKNSRRA